MARNRRLWSRLLLPAVAAVAPAAAQRVGAVRGWFSAPDCVSAAASGPEAAQEETERDAEESEPEDFSVRARELAQAVSSERGLKLARSLARLLDSELHYACKDEAAGEYIVRYPEGLGTEIVSDSEFVEFRTELSNLSDPEIAFDVEDLPDGGGFRYAYRVFNKAGAKRPIHSWEFVAAAADRSLELAHPDWRFARPETLADRPPAAPQAALFPDLQGASLRGHAAPGKYADWSTLLDEHPIQAGESLGDFTAVSHFRPGWTTAYVAGGSLVSTPFHLPEAVYDDITILDRIENSYSVVPVIGPAFAPDADRAHVAANWRLGLQLLLARGWLSADSAYIGELMHSLEQIQQAESQVELITANKPAKGMEALLDKIARMAL